MRKLHTLIAIAAMALLTLTAAAPSVAEITSPAADEIVFENTLSLAATAPDGATIAWGVREVDATDCEGSTQLAGSTRGMSDPFTFDDGEFLAELNIMSWPAGEYCFAFRYGPQTNDRTTVSFFIVDDYVKVGGVVNATENADRRGNGTHAFDGLVGDAGAAGIVGSITVNYRSLREVVTYEATSLWFRAADGIGASDPMAVAEIVTSDGTAIQVLDRDAHGDYPRGAITVRPSGWPSGHDADFVVDNTPTRTGADSWVKMTHGNNYTGTR